MATVDAWISCHSIVICLLIVDGSDNHHVTGSLILLPMHTCHLFISIHLFPSREWFFIFIHFPLYPWFDIDLLIDLAHSLYYILNLSRRKPKLGNCNNNSLMFLFCDVLYSCLHRLDIPTYSSCSYICGCDLIASNFYSHSCPHWNAHFHFITNLQGSCTF